MAKISWSFFNDTAFLFFTDKVFSASYTTGRQNQYDSYSPGGLTITLNNKSNYANNFNLGDKIRLGGDIYFNQDFWVTNIQYFDEGNNGAGSTAVITCQDVLGRLGRTQVFEQVINTEQTLTQIQNEFDSLMPSTGAILPESPGDSTAAALASFTGTVLDRINLNMATEQGWLGMNQGNLYLFARSDLANSIGSLIFDRTTSGAYQIGYSGLQRSGLGDNYINSFTVTPTVAAAQNSVNSTGQALYGIYSGELASVDDSNSQALGLAQWMTSSRDDPADLSFSITFSDLANDMTGFEESCFQRLFGVIVKYKEPASVLTKSLNQIMQGFTMEMTPQETIFTVFTSPLAFYNYFTLDSATLGVLDTSRLAW